MYGEVKSPQYPQPYPPNLQEQWNLHVPEGFQIRMTFTHLDIESSAGCLYDALTVRATFKYYNTTCREEKSRAEQSTAEQSTAEHSRAEQCS